MSIKHDQILNPITALEFFQDGSGPLLVLAGEGSYLKVFDAKTSQLLSKCEVFCGQAIHGIVVSPSRDDQNALQLVIYGGHHLQLMQKSHLEQILSQEVSCIRDTAISAPDWILDASVSPYDLFGCALVTAHNTVFRARLDETDRIVLEAASSPSRSILYSAHITWESDCRLLIAAGTVFGEIVVWECLLPGDGKTLYTFTGHEGSIFGVNISDPIFHLDGTTTRLLASCSDDRTIRIWDITGGSLRTLDLDKQLLLPQTGFGPKDRSGCEFFKPIATVMAHASRIWHVKLLSNGYSVPGRTTVGLLSFGEDAAIIQWDLELDSASPPEIKRPDSRDITQYDPLGIKAKLVLHDSFTFHSGKHIWSPAIHNDGTTSIIGTGGADGKISLFAITNGHLQQPAEQLNDTSSPTSPSEFGLPKAKSYSELWDIDDILGTLESKNNPRPELQTSLEDVQPEDIPVLLIESKPAKSKGKSSKKTKSDALNKYTFISKNVFLVTTTFGRILHGQLGTPIKWTEVALSSSATEDLRSYSVVVGFPEIELAYFGSANGNIYGYNKRLGLVDTGKVDGKVADMFKIYDPEARYYGLLVTVLMIGVAKFFKLDQSSLKLSSTLDFVLPEKFIVTSASKINGIFIFGSRFGSMAFYDPEQPQSPLLISKVVNSGAEDAITTILPLSSAVEGAYASHFLATRRDGAFSIFSVKCTRADNGVSPTIVELHQVHEGTPPLGSKIENAWFENDDLYLYGFKSRNFIVWNETKQREVTSVECGGAHRSYAFSSFPEGGLLIYTKASKLYLHSYTGISHRTIKPGGHGREIKSSAISQDQHFIATGAEDTAIRIWGYNYSLDNRISSEVVVLKHTTGIQHLQWHGSNYLLSSGGNEEFFIFKVSSIPNFGTGIVCEATCPDQSEERDLRITCFDIIDVDSCNEVLVTLAYSDSTIRSYYYFKATGFKLFATGRYTSSCITHLRYLKTADGNIRLLTAATDGYLTVWSSSPPYQVGKPTEFSIICTSKIHQNTIKSLSLSTSASFDFVMIATGGDDNALAFSIYPFLPSTTTTPSIFVLKSAHAAAITGLAAVSASRVGSFREDKETFRFVSSGNDQRLKMWEIRVTKKKDEGKSGYEVMVNMVAQRFTAVADVGDLTTFQARESKGDVVTKALVVGNGVEIWSIES